MNAAWIQVASLALVAVLGVSLGAQAESPAAYPWVSCVSVAGAAGSPGVVYAGFGSGIIVLTSSVFGPEPVEPPPTFGNRVDAGGMVMDLALTTTHLYAAAGRAGLVRFLRADMSKDLSVPLGLPTAPEFARTTAPFTHGGFDYAALGTDDLNGSGKVWVIRTDQPTSQAGNFTLGVPIYAVAATTSLLTNTLTLLVGTACAGAAPNHTGLLRYDLPLPLTLPFASAPTPTATWSFSIAGVPQPTFVRDIVLDNANQRAYVACYSDGVFRFNLMSGAMTIEPGFVFDKYPSARYHALAFVPTKQLLAIVHGPQFQGETTWWGAAPVPCDGNGSPDTPPAGSAIALYKVGPSSATWVASVTDTQTMENPLPGPPIGVSAFPGQYSSEVIVAVANDTRGYTAVQAIEIASGVWTAELHAGGQYGTSDGQPTGSHDDVSPFLGRGFVTSENSVVTYRHVPSAPLIEKLDLDPLGAVLLTSGLNASGAAPRLYTSAQGGVYIIDATNPNNPVPGSNPQGNVLLKTGGKAFDMALANGLESPTQRWLYVVNTGDCLTPGGNCLDPRADSATSGGLRVYRVGDATIPDVMTTTPLLGAAYQGMPSAPTADLMGAYIGVAVREAGSYHDVWVLFAHNAAVPPQVGILHFQATYDGTGVVFDALGKSLVSGWTSWAPNQGVVMGRLKFDPLSNKLYAGLGAAGIAIFNVSGGTPVQVGYRSLPGMTPLAVLPGPPGSGKVYFTTLRPNLGILPEATLGTSTPTLVPTRFQTIMMRADPTNPAILWLPQARGGIERVDVSGY